MSEYFSQRRIVDPSCPCASRVGQRSSSSMLVDGVQAVPAHHVDAAAT